MSPKLKAERLSASAATEPFVWQEAGDAVLGVAVTQSRPAPPARAHTPAAVSVAANPLASADEVPSPDRLAAIEREAFVKGYAQGERSGAETAQHQAQATLRRLSVTIDEVAALRAELMRRTERELVHLALVIAERVIRREVALDQELLVTMARVAIDRLGERASATIRLNPADYASLMAGRSGDAPTGAVEIVADPVVSRGGCLVRSDFGLMDLGLDAQLNEMSRALLGTDAHRDEEPALMPGQRSRE